MSRDSRGQRLYSIRVCGKTSEVAKLQDLLIYVTKGLSEITTATRNQKATVSPLVDNHVVLNLFTTITNANFDSATFYQLNGIFVFNFLRRCYSNKNN